MKQNKTTTRALSGDLNNSSMFPPNHLLNANYILLNKYSLKFSREL